MTDWNEKIIKEFRENDGKVGGPFEGAPLLLLHTTGARTGETRINPMMYQVVDGKMAVFASKSGATTNPDWYYNLKATPDAIAEVGTETFRVTAQMVAGADRTAIWERQKKAYPTFAKYEEIAEREIPVILLERVGAGSDAPIDELSMSGSSQA